MAKSLGILLGLDRKSGPVSKNEPDEDNYDEGDDAPDSESGKDADECAERAITAVKDEDVAEFRRAIRDLVELYS